MYVLRGIINGSCTLTLSKPEGGADYAHLLALPHHKKIFCDYDPDTALPVEIKMILLMNKSLGHLHFFCPSSRCTKILTFYYTITRRHVSQVKTEVVERRHYIAVRLLLGKSANSANKSTYEKPPIT